MSFRQGKNRCSLARCAQGAHLFPVDTSTYSHHMDCRIQQDSVCVSYASDKLQSLQHDCRISKASTPL